MNKVLKVILIVVASAIITTAVLILLASLIKKNHHLPQRKINKVYVGMPSADVRTLLGKPYRTYSITNGTFWWVYGSEWQWYYFTVKFSAASNVIGFYDAD